MKLQATLLYAIFLISSSLCGQSITPWLTQGDQAVLLSEQSPLSFGLTTDPTGATITIDEDTGLQAIDGFGFALTQGSAEAIRSLDPSQKDILLNELFGNNGLGISMIRISIGASDLSNSVYSYNEVDGDVDMVNFSLSGPDAIHLIPLLQEILSINSSIKVLATPWSAPSWMKTNNSFQGGSLETQYYEAYALYFVKYLQAMQNAGIPIWGITPQNEPENPFNEPSMLMSASEQLSFINAHLGPQVNNAGFSPKIIAFDHNCDNTSYPTQVLNGSSYVDGAAFHLYAGAPSAMSTVRNNTGKNIYFTEQFTGVEGDFNGDFSWHMRNVVTGALNNWARTVLEWNLAAYSDGTPRTPGGCSDCLPAITVDNSSGFTRNVSYYIIGQVGKFVDPGAVRIESSSNNSDLYCTAFRNPDGEMVLLAYNDQSSNLSMRTVVAGKAFDYAIPPKSAVTFVWVPDASTPPGGTVQSPFNGFIPIPGTVEAEAFDEGNEGLAYSDSDDGNNGGQFRNTNADIEITSGGGYNLGWTSDGEWLEYSVDVFTTGTYDISFRVATPNNSGQLNLEMGGVDVSGVVSVSSTGGYQNWQEFVLNDVPLTTGQQLLRLNILVGGFNLDRITFTTNTVLPVSLSSWSATPLNKSVLLAWETAMEYESDYFRLERSTARMDFTEIYRTPTNGIASRYTYNDEELLSGQYFYRLVQVDRDGTEQFYPIRQVVINNKLANQIKISPNPARRAVTLEFPRSNEARDVSVQVFTTSGQRIVSFSSLLEAGQHHLPMQLPRLPAGLYRILIQSAEELTTLPLIIDRP